MRMLVKFIFETSKWIKHKIGTCRHGLKYKRPNVWWWRSFTIILTITKRSQWHQRNSIEKSFIKHTCRHIIKHQGRIQHRQKLTQKSNEYWRFATHEKPFIFVVKILINESTRKSPSNRFNRLSLSSIIKSPLIRWILGVREWTHPTNDSIIAKCNSIVARRAFLFHRTTRKKTKYFVVTLMQFNIAVRPSVNSMVNAIATTWNTKRKCIDRLWCIFILA